MLKRMCCMRLKTAGYVFGGIDIVVNTLLLASIVFLIFEYVAENGEGYMLIVLAIVFIKLQSDFIMILGIKMQRHLLLLPWLIISGIELIYIIFDSSTQMGYEIDDNENQSPEYSVMILLLLVIPSWLFGLYILYGIYSLYKEIQATRKHQQAQL